MIKDREEREQVERRELESYLRKQNKEEKKRIEKCKYVPPNPRFLPKGEHACLHALSNDFGLDRKSSTDDFVKVGGEIARQWSIDPDVDYMHRIHRLVHLCRQLDMECARSSVQIGVLRAWKTADAPPPEHQFLDAVIYSE